MNRDELIEHQREETQSVHNWIVRLNAADQEGGQDE